MQPGARGDSGQSARFDDTPMDAPVGWVSPGLSPAIRSPGQNIDPPGRFPGAGRGGAGLLLPVPRHGGSGIIAGRISRYRDRFAPSRTFSIRNRHLRHENEAGSEHGAQPMLRRGLRPCSVHREDSPMDRLRLFRPGNGSTRRLQGRLPILEDLEGRRLLSAFTVDSTADDGSSGTLAGRSSRRMRRPGRPRSTSTPRRSPPPKRSSWPRPARAEQRGRPADDRRPFGGRAISGGGLSRVFQIDQGVAASMSGLTIVNGDATGSGGGLINEGDATLSGCTISDNEAGSYAGLWNEGMATLSDCTIAGNSAASGNGGGVGNLDSIALTGCTISGNSAQIEGGGLYNQGLPSANMTLVDCTVAGNSAVSSGGGLAISGTAKLVACTISGNSTARFGGGLYTGTAEPAR